jgi:helicase
MCGRAGRPRFDTAGEAVLIARSLEEEERFLDDYLSAPPEDIVSRLAAEPALRMHLLALVASGEVRDDRELSAFFASTFYGHTLPIAELNTQVTSVRRFLLEHEFLEPGTTLQATAFGAMTSELYLDPMTAVLLRRALERAPIGVAAFSVLAAISATPDLPPLFLRKGEEADLLARFADEEAELLIKPEEEPLPIDLDLFLATLKTATILESWIDETPLVDLTARHGVGAGDVRAKVEDAEWLLFGASRLATRFQRRVARPIDELSLRVRYGVRSELLDLVRLRGVGRVRGRALYDAGFPDRESLRQAPLSRVSAVLKSPKVAEAILRQLRPTRTSPGAAPQEPVAPTAGAPETEGGSMAPPGRPGSLRRSARTLEEFHSETP